MELKEFIKAAVRDIAEAVSELQSELDNGAIVNPTLSGSGQTRTLTVDGETRPIERLTFDIAVAAAEATGVGGEARAGISILGVRFGTEAEARTENVSRLAFSIPVVLPSVHVKTPEEVMREGRAHRLGG